MKFPVAATRTSLAVGAIVIALVLYAGFRYPGSVAIFVLFNACYIALIVLIWPRPRFYVYTFFAALLFLGFCFKCLVQFIWAPGFVEPVGDFSNTPQEWDTALLEASFAALGVLAVRAATVLGVKRQRVREVGGRAVPVPLWFARRRRIVWLLSLLAVLALNIANLHFAFFQIGIKPALILPLKLNVLLAWLLNVGFALWIATLLFWDFRIDPRSVTRNLAMPLVEGFVAGVSTKSRLITLAHLVPYLVALAERWEEFRFFARRRMLVVLAAAFTLLVCASLLIVFLLRIIDYDEFINNAQRGETVEAFLGRKLVTEFPQLLIHRWTGLEGLLAAGAAPDRGKNLFLLAITDNPKDLNTSLFQRVAKTGYLTDDPSRFGFGSNAGVVAVLAFSGSLAVLLGGMALVTALLILTEYWAQRWTGNPFFLAVAGAALAFVVIQTTFPYLTAVYLLQLWVAIAFIHGLQRVGPTSRGPT